MNLYGTMPLIAAGSTSIVCVTNRILLFDSQMMLDDRIIRSNDVVLVVFHFHFIARKYTTMYR